MKVTIEVERANGKREKVFETRCKDFVELGKILKIKNGKEKETVGNDSH